MTRCGFNKARLSLYHQGDSVTSFGISRKKERVIRVVFFSIVNCTLYHVRDTKTSVLIDPLVESLRPVCNSWTLEHNYSLVCSTRSFAVACDNTRLELS